MKKTAILILEPMASEGIAILRGNADCTVDVSLDLKKAQVLEIIGNYDAVLVRSQTQVDREMIEAGTRLKLIGRAGVGVDNIDVETAKAHNIAVINTPMGNSISTAELAFGLVLATARKIPFAHNHVREKKWQRNLFKGTEVYNKTLGIVGFGNVGQKLAVRAKAFDMRVVAFDPVLSTKSALESGIENLTLDQLFAQSDFISLHCGLNAETRDMINDNNIAKMKKGVSIINAARGELIDTNALIRGLNQNHIAYAAIDVFRNEPPLPDDPLINHDRIIVTPHLGASTEEAQKRVSTLLAEEAIGFFQGNKSLSRIV